MFRGIFIATLILRIFQIIFVAGAIDPVPFFASIPPDITENVSTSSTLEPETFLAPVKNGKADSAGKSIAVEADKIVGNIQMDNGKNDGTTETEASDKTIVAENGQNVDGTRAQDQPIEDNLDKMLGKDQKIENSVENEPNGDEQQKQVDQRSALDLEEEKKRILLLAAEDQNNDEPIVAIDWLTGDDLTEKQAESTKLLIPKEGNGKDLKYQASNPGPTAPVKLTFEDEKCSANEPKNVNHFRMKICKEKKENQQCPAGIHMCFPGKMDTKNHNNSLIEQFALANINELANVCKKELEGNEEWQKEWEGKELHAIKIDLNKEGNFEITASFTNETATVLKPIGDQCVILSIGEEKNWFGSYEDANTQHHEDPNSEHQKILVELANGAFLGKFPALKVLPLDLLHRYQEPTALMAFFAEKACDISIYFTAGDGAKNLVSCKNQDCTEEIHETAAEIKKSIYKKEYEKLQPVLSPSQLPPKYQPYIQFRIDPKTNESWARISSTGEVEIVFALATIGLIKPEFTFFRPPNAKDCTVKLDPDANELVLVINGRPDCFARFAWGERAFFFKDDMEEINRLVSTRDMPIRWKGENEDEIWTVNEIHEEQMLGTCNCPIEAHRIRRRYKGIEEHDYIFYFVISPIKGTNTPRAKQSQCKIGLDINLERHTLLLPNIAVKKPEQPPNENKPEGEKNGE